MSRIKQQLVDLGHHLNVLERDLNQSREQYEAIDEMAEDAHIRAIVSENPMSDRNDQEMQVSKNNLHKVIVEMQNEIIELKKRQDELLEKLFEESKVNEN